MILARLVGKAQAEGASIEAAFTRYDQIRRGRVMENYTRAAARWEGAKNHSWLYQQFVEFFMWAYLLAFWNMKGWGFEYDAPTVELGDKL